MDTETRRPYRVGGDARKAADSGRGRLPLRALDALGRGVRKSLARRAAPRGSALILLYHRVAEPSYDPWGLAVSARTFGRHLDYLNAEWSVRPLPELIGAARAGRLPERGVAITFDDGYVDNVEAALPMLEAHATPASFYVATGFVGRRIFWWDELHVLLAGPGDRPPRLDVAIGGHRLTAATESPADRRHALTEVVHPALRFADGATVERGLAVLREWAGPVEIPTDVVGRPVDSAELARLSASDLVEIGAHSVGHPSFPSLSRGARRAEVSASRDFVAEVAGRRPAGFSFPFGDNDPLSRAAVRSSGFDYAVGVGEPMPLTATSRRFELPRLFALEEPASALAERMEAALAFRRLP